MTYVLLLAIVICLIEIKSAIDDLRSTIAATSRGIELKIKEHEQKMEKGP